MQNSCFVRELHINCHINHCIIHTTINSPNVLTSYNISLRSLVTNLGSCRQGAFRKCTEAGSLDSTCKTQEHKPCAMLLHSSTSKTQLNTIIKSFRQRELGAN